MSNPVVGFLLDTPDNIEIIRDQISKILVLELDNQYQLALAASDPAATDYYVDIFVENDELLQLLQEENSFPLVNITLQNTVIIKKGSSSINIRKMLATFFVDCYTTGNLNSGSFTGTGGVIRGWKLGRLIRNILSAGDYTYLKLRKIVGSKTITKMETVFPNFVSGSIKVCMCRIELVVEYDEFSPQTNGSDLEGIAVAVYDANSKILLDF